MEGALYVEPLPHLSSMICSSSQFKELKNGESNKKEKRKQNKMTKGCRVLIIRCDLPQRDVQKMYFCLSTTKYA